MSNTYLLSRLELQPRHYAECSVRGLTCASNTRGTVFSVRGLHSDANDVILVAENVSWFAVWSENECRGATELLERPKSMD